jgi:NAD(P)-dependent dehydrogenase (short-subunit alcohol dehydrogenase family)
MKVLVVGGYGVFGERVARLLRRDGHAVTVAGRDLASAQRLTDEIGAQALRFDRERDLDRLPGLDVEVLVDAAGPFHAYGDRPYALAEACLRAGVHYLDLADDPGFCAGVAALDGLAREHGRVALSGASSVPAISAAAVRELGAGLQHIDAIDTAILPGNRAPRGLSVMAGILEQCGRDRVIWLDRGWRRMRGWSAPRVYALGPSGPRRAYRIGVPDLDLFPSHFDAASVSFRAGLELGVMNRALALLSRLRARHPFAIRPGLVKLLKRAADALERFGSDRGGMCVEVIGRAPDQGAFERVRRRWTLLAEAGDGPWVPAMPVRALLRGALPEPGARPCLETPTLDQLERAMDDCRIRFERGEDGLRALFASVPGVDLLSLPEPIRSSHAVFHTRVLSGRARVERGRGLFARVLSAVFGFPPDSENIEVEVTKTREDGHETWRRRFGSSEFESRLRIVEGRMRERFGAFEFELDLHIADASLHFPVRRGWLLGLPLPRSLLPRSEASEFVEDGRFRFDVALEAPLGLGRVVRYRGWLA